MTHYRLSVLIPARNEHCYDIDLLHETVVNVLANTSAKTEVVVCLDGYTDSWPKQPLPVSDRLTVIHHRQSIGQRAATNEAARIATGEYLMKLDAHCALDENFDEKLLATFEPHWTVMPAQYNLLAFNWRCNTCGALKDQGPKPDKCQCKGRRWTQQKLWIPRDGREGSNGTGGKRNSLTHSWYFDTTLTFGYWGAYAADEKHALKHKVPFRPETQQPIHDTMCLLGACWAMRRERYFDLNICDEQMGSWGQQGVEVACKSWLSGGELKVNTTTWFAHFFRVGGLNFPYPDGGRKERAVAKSKELWLKNSWPKQVYPLRWLVEKFAPVKDWHTGDNPVTQAVTNAGEEFYRQQGEQVAQAPAVIKSKLRMGAIYYTCNSHDETLELAARNNLRAAVNGHELGCVALQRTDFGDWSIVIDQPKGPLTMHQQILAGLERSTADYVFFCENDVLYHPSHFEFIPPQDDIYYYNTNVWRVRHTDGFAVRTDDCKQLSGLCANRLLLLEHYRKRVERIGREGFSRKNGYEPGTRGLPNGYDNHKAEQWASTFPNLDITAHGANVTKAKWSPSEFRNPKYAAGWQESRGQVGDWPLFYERLREWLIELAHG